MPFNLAASRDDSEYEVIEPTADQQERARAFMYEYAALCTKYRAEIGPVTHGDELGVLVDDEPVLRFGWSYKPGEVSPTIIRRRVKKSRA